MNWEKYLRREEIKEIGDGESPHIRKIELGYFINKINKKKSLDVGASKQIDLFLKKLGFKIESLSIIPKHGDYTGDMHQMPFNDEEYENVFCLHTLEHSISPYILLCEINRILKTGGYLIIIVPEAGCFWDFYPHHYFCPTVGQLWSLLHKTGFDIIETLRFKFRINKLEENKEIGILSKKIRGWKHDLKTFKTHFTPIETTEININPQHSIQYILKRRDDNKIKSTWI